MIKKELQGWKYFLEGLIIIYVKLRLDPPMKMLNGFLRDYIIIRRINDKIKKKENVDKSCEMAKE